MPFKLNFLSFIGFPILISLAIYLAVTSSSNSASYKTSAYNTAFSSITNFTLDLIPDFNQEIFLGRATFKINVSLANFKEFKKIFLDMNDQTIAAISLTNARNETISDNIEYSITAITQDSAVEKDIGRKLTITIPRNFYQNYTDNDSSDPSLTLVVNFTTSPNRNGRGVNWLKPEQTFSGKYPFFFTFCRPARCRTLAPMHDSLDMQANFNVNVVVPSPLRVKAAGNLTQTPFSYDASSLISNMTRVYDLDYDNMTAFKFAGIQVSTPSLLNIAIGVFEEQEIVNGQFVLSAEPEILKNCSDALSKAADSFAIANQVISSSDSPTLKGLNIMIMPMAYMESISFGSNLMFVPLSMVLNERIANTTIWEVYFSSFFGVMKFPSEWSDWYLLRGLSHYLSYQARYLVDPEWAKVTDNVTANMLLKIFDELCCRNCKACIFSELNPNLNGENTNEFDHMSVPEFKGYFFMKFLAEKMRNTTLNRTTDKNFLDFVRYLVNVNNTDLNPFYTRNEGSDFTTWVVDRLEKLVGAKQSIKIRRDIKWIKWQKNHAWNGLSSYLQLSFPSQLMQRAWDIATLYFNGSTVTQAEITELLKMYYETKISILVFAADNLKNETLAKLLDENLNLSSSNDCGIMQTILMLKVKSFNLNVTDNTNRIIYEFKELARKCGSRENMELSFTTLYGASPAVALQVYEEIKNSVHPLIKESFETMMGGSQNVTRIVQEERQKIKKIVTEYKKFLYLL